MKKALILAATHAAALLAGFALGIYLLPILAAPPGPSATELKEASRGTLFEGEFRRGLRGSDPLHWGEGRVSIAPGAVSLQGRLAPGPAYRLYAVPEFVETGEDFQRLKARSAPLGDIRTFENFVVPVPPGVRMDDYRAVVVWCEAFSQFISAARYR